MAAIGLTKTEYMADYIKHLQYASERLMTTFDKVRSHSHAVADNVWSDSTSLAFMEQLDAKQAQLRNVSETLDHYRSIMIEMYNQAVEIERHNPSF